MSEIHYDVIDALEGDDVAVQRLFVELQNHAKIVARSKMDPGMNSLFDSDDIAQEAWLGFLENRQKPRRDKTKSHQDCVLAICKYASESVTAELRKQFAQKRDRRRTVALSDEPVDPRSIRQAIDPEFEEFMLRHPKRVQKVVALRLMGYSTNEVAKKCKASPRNIRRLIHQVKESLDDR